MANIVTLSGPSPTQEIISHFVDQFGQDRRVQQQQDLERQQLAQTGRYQQGELGVRQGLLKNAQDKFNQLREEYDNQQINAEAAPVLAKLQQMFVAADSAPDQARKAAIEAEAKQFIANQSPRIQGKIKYETVRPFMTPERQGKLGAESNFAARQTPGTTEPYAVAESTKVATGDFPTGPMFTQAQAGDLEARGKAGRPVPRAASGIPAPSASPVSNLEAMDTGAMPTGPQRLTAQTSITDTGMREAGATERERMQIKAKEIPAGIGGTIVQGVITDPQSYYALPTEDKKVVLKTLGRAPSKLTATESDRLDSAKLGRQLIDDADQIVKKWQTAGTPITGPALGRFNAAQGTWGDMIIPPNLPQDKQREYAQDISQLREWLTALPIMEAKALAGGRTAYQVIQAVTSAAPSLAKGQDMFEGSVMGLRARFDQVMDHLNKKQWGGKPPQGSAASGDSKASADFNYVIGKGLVAVGGQ